MAHFEKSLAQLVWPKERFSLHLCVKCGDCFHSDLHELNYDETVHRVRLGFVPGYSHLVDDAQRQMDRLQHELCRIQNLSRALEAQQELLGMYMTGLRSVTSPIHKLPQEVLGEIFKVICCGDIGVNFIENDRRLPSNSKRLPTITISRVCLRWYNLVTSMPVLWSSFGTGFSHSSYNLSLVNLFLERSRLHPIDLSMTHVYPDSIPFPIPSTLAIIRNANRWRHIVVNAQNSLIVKMLQLLIDSRPDLPALTSLTLSSTFANAFLVRGGLLSFPMECLNLQSLTLAGVPLNLEYPRTSVTTLDLADLSPPEIGRIIFHCPNVQNVALKRFTESNMDINIPTNIGSYMLHLAIIFNHGFNFLRRLCDSLTCSKLTHFELSNMSLLDSVDHIPSLCSMLEQGHGCLTHLTIRHPFTSRGLLRLFLCVGSVTTLRVEESDSRCKKTAESILKILVAHDQNAEEFESDSEPYESDESSDYSTVEDDLEDDDIEDDDIEDDDIIPDGQCILPQLTDLTLVLNRSYSQSVRRLVRSRWRPLLHDHPHTENFSGSPCVYLKKLRIQSKSYIIWNSEKGFAMLRKGLEPLQKDGMDVEVIT